MEPLNVHKRCVCNWTGFQPGSAPVSYSRLEGSLTEALWRTSSQHADCWSETGSSLHSFGQNIQYVRLTTYSSSEQKVCLVNEGQRVSKRPRETENYLKSLAWRLAKQQQLRADVNLHHVKLSLLKRSKGISRWYSFFQIFILILT